MFYIEQGQIRLTVLSTQGKEAIIGLLDSGDFCGEGGVVGERVRPSAAMCIADSASCGWTAQASCAPFSWIRNLPSSVWVTF